MKYGGAWGVQTFQARLFLTKTLEKGMSQSNPKETGCSFHSQPWRFMVKLEQSNEGERGVSS